MRLLIIRLSALGDVAMLVPVVKALASQRADLDITVLSMPAVRPLFEEAAPNVHFIAFDKRGEHKGFGGLNRLYSSLAKEGFDAVADCHDVLRTKYLRLRFLLDGKRVTHIDKHRAGKRALTRDKNKILEQQPTSFQNYVEAIAPLVQSAECRVQSFEEVQSAECHRAAQLCTLHSALCTKENSALCTKENSALCTKENSALCTLHSALKVGVAPFAAHKGKIYPLEKMLEVVRTLLDKGVTVWLFGAGKDETAVFNEWREKLSRPERLLISQEHTHGLADELRLMATLDCMITMDSANQHLAALAGTRVVSVWGATHPYAGFLAWQQSPDDCVQLPLPCRPCSIYGNRPCRDGSYRCLTGITPAQIVEKALNSDGKTEER